MGTKKKFILFFGVGWCGTTSLYYTLQDYMHGGWVKENRVLARIFLELNKSRREGSYQLLMNGLEYKGKDPVKLQFTEQEINSIFSPGVSLSRYVAHYKKLAEYCGDRYMAVGDFSNTNYDLTVDMLHQINEELKKYFDVMPIIILRDPIRRIWSETCAFTNNKFFKKKNGYNCVKDTVQSTLCLQYTDKIKQLYKVFGEKNVCYLIMEDFFKDQKNNFEVSKLEKFLNININKVYPCVFVPDKGINPPKLDGLKDQWCSDHEVLTPEFYNMLRFRKDYEKEYNSFKELHGCLPADWGRIGRAHV